MLGSVPAHRWNTAWEPDAVFTWCTRALPGSEPSTLIKFFGIMQEGEEKDTFKDFFNNPTRRSSKFASLHPALRASASFRASSAFFLSALLCSRAVCSSRRASCSARRASVVFQEAHPLGTHPNTNARATSLRARHADHVAHLHMETHAHKNVRTHTSKCSGTQFLINLAHAARSAHTYRSVRQKH